MARTSDLEGGKANTRKRKLNLIYFVDSARTKSLSIPLLQLKLLIAFLFLLLTWSIGSTAAITWLVLEKTDLASRLESSLATVFEYESRYDGVYDTAYPPENRKPQGFRQHSPQSPSQEDPLLAKDTAQTGAAPEHANQPNARIGRARSETPSAATPNSGLSASPKTPDQQIKTEQIPELTTKLAAAALPSRAPATEGAPPQATPASVNDTPSKGSHAQATTTAVPGSAASQPSSTSAPASPPTQSLTSKSEEAPPVAPKAPSKDLESVISVTNPVLEPKKGQLDLRFDLTNRSNKARAEGYIWAIAEFRTDDGRIMYLGAPGGIDVSDKGEPRNPRLSAPFGIRHFKRKSFTFPYLRDRSGTFTAIRIGVMDKTGADRTTYNVPVEIRVPKGS